MGALQSRFRLEKSLTKGVVVGFSEKTIKFYFHVQVAQTRDVNSPRKSVELGGRKRKFSFCSVAKRSEAKIFFGSATFRRKFFHLGEAKRSETRRKSPRFAQMFFAEFRLIFFALFRLAFFAEIRRVSPSFFRLDSPSFAQIFFAERNERSRKIFKPTFANQKRHSNRNEIIIFALILVLGTPEQSVSRLSVTFLSVRKITSYVSISQANYQLRRVRQSILKLARSACFSIKKVYLRLSHNFPN